MQSLSLIDDSSPFPTNSDGASTKALLRVLDFAKVKFIRYLGIDIFNSVRCKAIPVDRLRKKANPSLDNQIAFVRVVFEGLPSFADALAFGDATSTLVLQPDLSTLRVLPYSPTSAVTLGYLFDQKTGQLSDLCTRGLLRRLVNAAAEKHNLAFNVGAELEFCLFNAETNKPVDMTNFADTTLLCRKESFISDLYDQLVHKQDIEVELIHAESANGQFEVVLAYQSDPVVMADNVVLARETVRHLAHDHGLKALFLPKHNLNQAGSGCHVHLSVRDTASGVNLFVDQDSPSSIGKIGKSFMEGILQHLPALLAVSMPTVNSHRRMAEGCWTGHQATWAFDDKEAPLRVVSRLEKQSWDHVEFKLCDSSANLYLALACILGCGLDGIVRDLALRPPRDETKEPESLPTSLNESLEKLENDDLLKKLMPERMLEAYLAVRRIEQERSAAMSHEQEVQEALDRA